MKFAVFLAALIVGLASGQESEQRSYRGDNVINAVSQAAAAALKDFLASGVVQQWGGNGTHSQLHIAAGKVKEVLNALFKSNVGYEVITEDLQQDIEDSNPPVVSRLRNVLINGHSMDWTSYHRLDDFYTYMEYLASKYPKIASVGSAGKTVEGRELRYLKISSGAANPKKFWVDGGIHAREWAAPAAAAYVMRELVENRSKYASIVSNIDFYVMPLMNPDGYEHSMTRERMWRKNRNKHQNGCVGVDLNRNWGFNWGTTGISHNPCDPQIYAGSKPFSEPETQSISKFILSIKNNLQAYISFHTYGQYILIPYAFDNVSKPSDFEELRRVAVKAQSAMKAVAGETYQVGHTPTLVGAAAGGSDDWAKGTVGVKYTYTFELRPTNHRVGFALPASQLAVAAQEALAGVLAVAKEL